MRPDPTNALAEGMIAGLCALHPLAGTGEGANGRHSRFCADQILVARPRHGILGACQCADLCYSTDGVWRVLQKGQ